MSPLAARLLTIACVTAYVVTGVAVCVGTPAALLSLSAACAVALWIVAIPEVL